MQINVLAIPWKYSPFSVEHVFAALIFAALLFAARVNNSSGDNPFPRRRLPVHVSGVSRGVFWLPGNPPSGHDFF